MDRDAAIRTLSEEGLLVTEWTDPPNESYPEHTHPHDEVRWVVSGSLTVWTPSGEWTLVAGDRIDLPAGTPHRARVGTDGVRYLAGSSRRT